MLSTFIKKLNQSDIQRANFISDLNSVLSNLKPENIILATHSHCTDGSVAGGMLRYKFPGAKIIPIDYWYLNNELCKEHLENVNWHGIVDLKPFNRHQTEFWVDHHTSSVNQHINSKKIKFDIDGDSGAYQLYLSGFIDPIPEHLLELALMTRITDTASFTTPLPVEQIDSLEELQYEPTYNKSEDLVLYERKVWFLSDSTSTQFTYKELQNLYTGFAKDGFYYLKKLIKRTNKLREERKKAFEIADGILKEDIVCFSYKQDKLDAFSIRRRLLMSDQIKVVISFSNTSSGYGISFRRSKRLSKEVENKVQLHLLANKFGGGGHPGASGGFTKELQSAKKIIGSWANNLNYRISWISLEND